MCKLNDIKTKYNLSNISKEFEEIIKYNNNYKNLIKLDISSIINANNELQVDFVNYGLIPVFDAFDNDYICYQINNNKWCMFNITDETVFKKDSFLQDLLNFKS